ncbi:MAG: HD domain-containing protein [Candidatus Brocadiaceae bacterium]
MRDACTAGHQRRVTQLACAIAREIGISEYQIEGIRIAGILHDIGKISVPSEIVSKPGKLSNKEGNVCVALSPELNVSGFGDTIEDAKRFVKEAIEIFIEECQEMGTLEGVLDEAGFSRINDSWELRKPVTHIRTNMTTAGMTRERFFELLEQAKE